MTDTISGKTIICGLIGDPVEHTMSPVMHNTAFKALGLDYVYLPFKVKSLELRKAIEGMRALNIRGLNVTLPHKVSVMQFLDKVDPLAEKIGAVNTIVNDDGILTGYNTDGHGFLQALRDQDIELENKRVLLIGAGGVARAIGCSLAEERAQINVLNREQELSWAEELAHRLNHYYGIDVNIGELNDENLQKGIDDADILINATSIGMTPDIDNTPVPANLLCTNLNVFDAVYSPLQTRLLREAEIAGARTIDGTQMLVWQGAIAFEKWTNKQAPIDIMRKTIKNLLEE